jgi:hypothetical protein
MIIIILFIIFIIYIICRKNKILESFLERDDSKLRECSHLIENINNHFELYKQRKLSYSHPKHKTFGIMRPLLFYFWNNSVASSKNFKENIFDNTTLSNCPPSIKQQLSYLTGSIVDSTAVGKSPYGKIRENLQDLKLPLKTNGKSLFQSDSLYQDDSLINNKEFYIFRQTYPDFHGNELSKEFKFNQDIDNPGMESSEDYHQRSSDINLRILDFDLGCYGNTPTAGFCGHTVNKLNQKNPDRSIRDCCYLDNNSGTNIGIKRYDPGTTDKCCKNVTAMAFVPESYLIFKFIYFAKNEFLQNLTYYGYNDYNIVNGIISNNITSKAELDEKSIISQIPQFVLWDGFGVYVKKDTTNNLFYVHIINEDSGDDLKIDLEVSDRNWGVDKEISLHAYHDNAVFKNFIKNHIHVYRKNGLNFFEYMCLEFKKIAFDNNQSFLYDDGTNPKKYLVQNNEITEHGFKTAQELYKYHVKSETNFNALEGNVPLYKDLHIDYFVLTKWYGNNNCKYYNYKRLYEMENTDFDWEVCDIMKFILNTLYLPYRIMDPGRGCFSNDREDGCWGDELVSHYNNPTQFNCKIKI